VYRASNQLADWLANVAKELTMSENLTDILRRHHADLSPFSEPPFSCKTIREQLQRDPGQTDLIAYVGDFEAGEMGKLGPCDVCGGHTKWVIDR
jgi:hypothetical protein